MCNEIISYSGFFLYVGASNMNMVDCGPSLRFSIINSVFIHKMDRGDFVCKMFTL
jgi:hypothetical protein